MSDEIMGVAMYPTPGVPLEYSVYEDGSRPDLRITLDGEEVRRVTAYDALEGWVEMHCARDAPGHGPAPHVHPAPDIDAVCTVRYSGVVQVGMKGG